MSKISWSSDKEKFEAIGYLACPGVISHIEAMVPEDRLEKFKKRYDGKYTSEYPYVMKAGSKYGDQLRICLNDSDGCPETLKKYLDARYGTRINDTGFIRFLVQTFDFKITNSPQDSERIKEKARFLNDDEYECFLKGFYGHEAFINTLKKEVKSGYLVPPNIVDIPTVKLSRRKKKVPKNTENKGSSYTPEQLRNIGWAGENYIYLLLQEKERKLLEALHLIDVEFSIQWFNEGYDSNENWQDKSVGEGCDIVVNTGGKKLFLEVKTSKKSSDIFTMTNFEMITMKEKDSDYYIIKINWIERLVESNAPEIMIYENPYNRLFRPVQMKETTFYVRSFEDE
ncbi:hypothetical protein M2145_001499 [Lachnospiraceae bacterium PF1-21]